MGQDIRPDGVFWVWRTWDDPEALVGVMNNGNDFVGDRSNGPVFAKEVQGVIGVETALEVEGQMKV